MTQTDYQPGVCNIGPEEIARRRNFGWGALGITVLSLVILVWIDAGPWWRLMLFFPAAASASGFLQAHFRFCYGFSRAGVFNFGELGETQTVTNQEDLARDRRRGNQIALYSALIGTTMAVLAVVIG